MAAVAIPSPIEIARAELGKLSAELERVVAEREAAIVALRDLVRVVERIGGYMSPAHRITLDVARATLVEAEAGR